MHHLLCLILLNLVESQEGVFGLELTLQRVEEDLLLVILGLAILQALMHALIALPRLLL